MSLNKLIPQPLPVYNNISDSYYIRKNCTFEDRTIVSDLRHVPSFILNRPTSIDNTFTFEQVDSQDNVCTTFTINQEPCYSTVLSDGQVTDILAFDFPKTNIDLCCGYYHIKITNGSNVWYTELVNFKDFDYLNSDYTKIEYASECNVEGVQIPFRLCPDFRFRFYLNELNGECCPTRTLSSEVETNENLQDVEVSKTYVKTYNLRTFLIPHYLVDAFYFMSTIDNGGLVNIFPRNENQNIFTGTCVKNMSIEKIDEDGKCCFEQLQVSFQREDNIINNGCCGDIDEIDCLTPIQTIKNINTSAGFIEDPSTLSIGDCYYISETADDTSVFSNVPCITVTEMNTHVGEVACWNGTCFDFTPPEQYSFAIINPNNPNTIENIIVELVNGLYQRIPTIDVSNTGIGTGSLTSEIPEGYFGCLEVSIDGGTTYSDLGMYSKDQLSNGVNVSGNSSGFPQSTFKLTVKNYNCTIGVNEDVHSFTGS